MRLMDWDFSLSIASAMGRIDEPSTLDRFVTELHIDIDLYWVEVDESEHLREIGEVEVVLVHVGAAYASGENVYDVLRAGKVNLAALHDVYFERGWFRSEFVDGAGVDLLYIASAWMTRPWEGRNIELAAVQRICETIGAGCKLVAKPFASSSEAKHWMQMGFEVSTHARGGSRYMHRSQAQQHPRVVPAHHPRDVAEPHKEGRFKVVLEENRTPATRSRRRCDTRVNCTNAWRRPSRGRR
jgi:hypothetical protein